MFFKTVCGYFSSINSTKDKGLSLIFFHLVPPVSFIFNRREEEPVAIILMLGKISNISFKNLSHSNKD